MFRPQNYAILSAIQQRVLDSIYERISSHAASAINNGFIRVGALEAGGFFFEIGPYAFHLLAYIHLSTGIVYLDAYELVPAPDQPSGKKAELRPELRSFCNMQELFRYAGLPEEQTVALDYRPQDVGIVFYDHLATFIKARERRTYESLDETTHIAFGAAGPL